MSRVIGCLGDIIFRCDSRQIKTPDNIDWVWSTRYAEHKRPGRNALTEFSGNDADTLTFDMVLSTDLGVSNVMNEVLRVRQRMEQGRAMQLVIGSRAFGRHKWTIDKVRVKLKELNPAYVIQRAVLTVSLKEYLRQ